MSENKIQFVFFGTPDFAVGVLEELEKKNLLPSLVITAPDKPQGRGLTLTPPPVKVWAEARKISILQPEKLNEEFLNELKKQNWDLFVVAAYGKIIPKNVLDFSEHGTLNVHPSLLPRLRGASPVQSAILSEEKTGVTIMQIDEEMDHGPIVAQRERVIKDFTSNPPRGSELESDLAHFGGELLAEVIPEWISGKITPAPQDHTHATFCKKITKEDGLIDLASDPLENLRKIRAFDVWPGAYFFYTSAEKRIRVRITDAEIREGEFRLLRVVPEGKKEMSFEDFSRGMR